METEYIDTSQHVSIKPVVNTSSLQGNQTLSFEICLFVVNKR